MTTRFTPPAIEATYADAARLFQAGRLDAASARLGPLLDAGVADPRVWALAGFVRLRRSDPSGAVPLLARARQLDPRDPVLPQAQGEALRARGQPAEAAAAFRVAMLLGPGRTPVLVGLANARYAQGDETGALALMEERIAAGDRDHTLLVTCAELQDRLDYKARALATWRIATESYRDSGVAWHNLAAALGDATHYPESEAAARRAMALRQAGPATVLVLARALQGQGRVAEAEEAYREVVRLSPTSVDPQRELSQLIWMRTGDLPAAAAPLRATLATAPGATELVAALARLQEFAGDLGGARATLMGSINAAREPDTSLLTQAADVALASGDAEESLRLAERALRMDSQNLRHWVAVIDACLGTGDAVRAEALCAEMMVDFPNDQGVIARRATAWRMLGDPRYARVHDYDLHVRPYQIDTPQGWPTLEAYLADLAKTLVSAHVFSTHPFNQSLRGGSQTVQNLALSPDPTLKAFFKAIDGPIRRHMEHLRADADGLGKRYTGDYRLSGAWSVFLRPNGFHVDHVHPVGWISSAFYVELPHAPADDPRAGWIKFGEPGIETRPKLGPEHYVEPKPGTLVLFPSYMWHGTVPFRTDERRLTIAFDVQPA